MTIFLDLIYTHVATQYAHHNTYALYHKGNMHYMDNFYNEAILKMSKFH